MGAPRFVSPGALFQNAIAQLFQQRAEEERRAITEEAERQRQAEQLKLQQGNLDLQRQQEARIAEAQRAAQADIENQRAFTRASTIAENAMPGDAVDETTAALLRTQGFGGQIQQTPPTQGAYLGDDENMVPQYNVVPGILQMRGGSKFLNAQAQREATAANAEATRQAAAERAASDRETRMAIAQMGAAGKSETTALRNDLLQTQIAAANEKAEAKKNADKKARDAARVTSQATIDVLKQLADFDEAGTATLKPGTANLFGMRNPLAQFMPGSDTANAAAALDRLKGRAIVDLLNEMKNQSATGATGFGALSGPELRLLENSATQLTTPNIGDVRAAEELSRIYKMATQLYGGGEAAPDAPGAVVRWGRDANGRPVRLP